MTPNWTLASLAAAVQALPAGTTAAAAATALAAQTTTLTNQVFTVAQAQLIAIVSGNVSWARIVQRARQTANLPPTTELDVAILAATTITEMSPTQTIDPTIADGWAAWQAGIAALQAVGDLSAADVTAIAALTTVSVPTFQPAPTAADVTAALASVAAPVTGS